MKKKKKKKKSNPIQNTERWNKSSQLNKLCQARGHERDKTQTSETPANSETATDAETWRQEFQRPL